MDKTTVMQIWGLVVSVLTVDVPLSAQNLTQMDELTNRLTTRFTTLAPEDRTQFIKLIKPAVGMEDTLADDATIEVGQSKIGGRPDLPASFEWPAYNDEPLTFCAQYNLAEAVPFDPDGALPEQGLLSVFLNIDKDCPCFSEKAGTFKIVYSEDVSSLKRTDFPVNYF